MLGVSVFYHSVIDQGFCYVVCDQSAPYFLFYIFRSIGMEVAQSNGIFQFAERPFYGPSGKIQLFYTNDSS